MTIPEAVSLILQAGAMADGYGTYVLEMGRPIRITDLARKMIEIMGAPNVQFKFIGLRPGQKLKEELFEDSEQRMRTDHPMVFHLFSENMSPPDDSDLAERVDSTVFPPRSREAGKSLELLRRAIPNYPPAALPEIRDGGLKSPPQW